MRKFFNGEIALGLLLASLFWISVLGWQAAHAPTEREKAECQEQAQKSGHKTEECKTLWERTTSDPVAFFTLWIAIFTAVLGGSTIALWLAGERQIELIRENSVRQAEQMQASIAAAKSSVDQAKRAADVAERAMVLTDRPWIDINLEIAGPLKFGPELIEIRIKGTFTNVGKSPATYVHFTFGLCPDVAAASSKADEDTKWWRDIPIAARGFGHVLFPGKDESFGMDVSITRDEFTARIKEMDAIPMDEPSPPFTKSNPGLYGLAYYGVPSAGRSGRPHHTILLLSLDLKDPEHDGFDGTEQGEFPADTLKLVQAHFGADAT
jgi:hypothetical protein